MQERLVLAAVVLLQSASSIADTPATSSGMADGRGDSPYAIVLATPRADLTADFTTAPRADAHAESDVAYAEWYGSDVQEKFHAWGPRPRQYPAPVGLEKCDVVWQRERVVAAAEKLLGYAYQHHHVPDWDPPSDWEWKPTCARKNSKGLDCSNFTTFVYDYALGIRFTSDVGEQSALRSVKGPGGEGDIEVVRIERGDSYRAFADRLATADLVFVKNVSGEISHVVIWLGAAGRAPDGTPLVIDSHGDSVKDTRGETIPCGIQIRPFREDGWYWRSSSHALRIVTPRAKAPAAR